MTKDGEKSIHSLRLGNGRNWWSEVKTAGSRNALIDDRKTRSPALCLRFSWVLEPLKKNPNLHQLYIHPTPNHAQIAWHRTLQHLSGGKWFHFSSMSLSHPAQDSCTRELPADQTLGLKHISHLQSCVPTAGKCVTFKHILWQRAPRAQPTETNK